MLPKGWGETELRNVSSKVGSGATPRGGRNSYSRIGVPFVRSMNVHFAGFNNDGLVYLDEKQAKLLEGVKVEAGDVLLNITGASIGRVCLAPDCIAGARVNQHVCIIRPIKGASPRYVERFLAAPDMQKFILEENYGLTRQALTKEMIEAIKLPLPPLAEQRRIVAKLDALTARLARARAELERVPILAATLRAATLSQAFKGELTAAWRYAQTELPPIGLRDNEQLRPKYRSGTDKSEPYSLPANWRWARLPELGELDRGKSRHRPRNDPSLFGGEYPFIQTGDVRSAGQYLTYFTETYSEFGLAQSRRWKVGTVCITIAANIADSTILGIDACFPDSVVGFLPDEHRTSPEYIEYFIRTAKANLQQFAPATAQKNINLDTLSSVIVPVAPIQEQQAIVEQLKMAFARVDRLEAEAARAKKLLDRLESKILAKAFRGELVPQDPADEPASVLLDRIISRSSVQPVERAQHRPPFQY